jgi:hypothetical protein
MLPVTKVLDWKFLDNFTTNLHKLDNFTTNLHKNESHSIT